MKRMLCVFIGFAGACFAGADFDAGNKAYDEGKFIEARQRYEAQIARGEWTADVFYNLGNANERIGAPGLAMLNYERALVLQPDHHEARANLKFLREQSLSKVPDATWRAQVLGALTFDGWTILCAGLAWSAVFLVVVPVARRQPLSAPVVFWIVLAGCASAAAGYAAWQSRGDLAAGVVIAKEADARQAPTELSKVAGKLPAGSRVRVIGVRGEWTFCELPGGEKAWLPAQAVERIRLS